MAAAEGVCARANAEDCSAGAVRLCYGAVHAGQVHQLCDRRCDVDAALRRCRHARGQQRSAAWALSSQGTLVSYVQFARQGLGLQKSQIGPGMRVAGSGVFDVSYHRYGSQLPSDRQKLKEESFFDGIISRSKAWPTSRQMARSRFAPRSRRLPHRFTLPPGSSIRKGLLASAPYLATALDEIDALIASIDNTAINNAEQKAGVLHGCASSACSSMMRWFWRWA